MNDGNAIGGMRMRLPFGRRTMSCPARVADADDAVERVLGKQPVQIDELSLGTTAFDGAVMQRRNAGAVIAAIFEPLQRLEYDGRSRFRSDDADNSTHD